MGSIHQRMRASITAEEQHIPIQRILGMHAHKCQTKGGNYLQRITGHSLPNFATTMISETQWSSRSHRLQVREMVANFGQILRETSRRSALTTRFQLCGGCYSLYKVLCMLYLSIAYDILDRQGHYRRRTRSARDWWDWRAKRPGGQIFRRKWISQRAKRQPCGQKRRKSTATYVAQTAACARIVAS